MSTESRSTMVPFKSFRSQDYKAALNYRNWTYSTPKTTAGESQTISGYRGPKSRNPVWDRLHNADISKTYGKSTFLPFEQRLKLITSTTPFYTAMNYWGEVAGTAFCRYEFIGGGTSEARKLLDDYESYLHTRLLAKAKSPSFEGGTNLGELRETLQMLRRPLSAIRDLSAEMRKGFRPKGRMNRERLLYRYMTSQWLEYRYGIMPLVMSVRDLIDQLNTQAKEIGKCSVQEKTESVGQEYTKVNYVQVDNVKLRAVCTDVESTSISGTLYYSIESGFAQQWGLRLSDIPSVAVELTPYSFMADWIVNLSEFVRALTPTEGFGVLGVTCSVQQTSCTKYVCDAWSVDGSLIPLRVVQVAEQGCSTLVRRTRSSTVLPTLGFRFKDRFGFKQQLDLLSILSGKIKSIHKRA